MGRVRIPEMNFWHWIYLLLTVLLVGFIVFVGMSPAFAFLSELLPSGGVPPIEWQKSYPDSEQQAVRTVATCLDQNQDGSYILAGISIRQLPVPTAYGYLLRADSSGQKIWEKIIDPTVLMFAYGVSRTNDGGFIVSGMASSTTTGIGYPVRAALAKFNLAGDIVWAKTYEENYLSILANVEPCSDGSYIACGFSSTTGAGAENALVIKADQNGDCIWRKSFDSSGFADVAVTRSGDYIFCGARMDLSDDGVINCIGLDEVLDNVLQAIGIYANRPDNGDAFAVRLSEAGNLIWERIYPSVRYQEVTCIAPSGDGGYALSGLTTLPDNSQAALVVKIDFLGNEQWRHTYDEFGYIYSIIPSSNGGYLLAGPYMNASPYEGYLASLDFMGNMRDSVTVNDVGFYHSMRTADSGFAICGFARQDMSGSESASLLKLEKPGGNDTGLLRAVLN